MDRNEDELDLDEHLDAIASVLLTDLHVRQNERPSLRACLLLLLRLENTRRSIHRLVNSAADHDELQGVSVDCGALKRCMYDALIQLAYIVHQPERADARANDYLDYSHVERFILASEHVSGKSSLSKMLAKSPLRTEGEPRLRVEYDKVAHRFRKSKKNNKKGIRNQWATEDLRAMARRVGREEEYVFFVKTLHGCVHSSALAVSQGAPLPIRKITFMSDVIFAIGAKEVADFTKTKMPREQERILTEISKGYLNALGNGDNSP